MTTESSKNLIERSKEYFKKAYQLQINGNFEDAIKNYKLSIDIYPTAEAFTFLGWTYSFLGEYDRAIEECKNAISIDPGLGNPYNDIGAYLMRQGKFEESIPWFELAINSKKYDNCEFAHVNLGRALEKKGLWLEALEEYGIAIEKAPDYKIAKEHFNRLQGMLN
jgi:tetratricopeptide (TPR) repeat protein